MAKGDTNVSFDPASSWMSHTYVSYNPTSSNINMFHVTLCLVYICDSRLLSNQTHHGAKCSSQSPSYIQQDLPMKQQFIKHRGRLRFEVLFLALLLPCKMIWHCLCSLMARFCRQLFGGARFWTARARLKPDEIIQNRYLHGGIHVDWELMISVSLCYWHWAKITGLTYCLTLAHFPNIKSVLPSWTLWHRLRTLARSKTHTGFPCIKWNSEPEGFLLWFPSLHDPTATINW